MVVSGIVTSTSRREINENSREIVRLRLVGNEIGYQNPIKLVFNHFTDFTDSIRTSFGSFQSRF